MGCCLGQQQPAKGTTEQSCLHRLLCFCQCLGKWNQVCCQCQGRDQGERVQIGASCFQWSLPLPGEVPSDSRSCLSRAVSWFKGMLFSGEHALTVVAFSNTARFVPCVSKGRVSAMPLPPDCGAAWLLILLCSLSWILIGCLVFP